MLEKSLFYKRLPLIPSLSLAGKAPRGEGEEKGRRLVLLNGKRNLPKLNSQQSNKILTDQFNRGI
jgi:hypothetical protein